MAPAFSPDGTQVAFVARMPGNTSKTQPVFARSYVAPADQPGKARLVTKKAAAGGMHAAWSPDGTRLAFGAGKAIPSIWVVGVDGRGLTRLTTAKLGDGEPSWSPDGKQIADNSTAEADAVWIMNADGTGARQLATADTGASRSRSPRRAVRGLREQRRRPQRAVADPARRHRRPRPHHDHGPRKPT